MKRLAIFILLASGLCAQTAVNPVPWPPCSASVTTNCMLTAPDPTNIVASGSLAFGKGAYSSGNYHNQNAAATQPVTATLPAAAPNAQYCLDNSYNGSAPDTGTLRFQAAANQYLIKANGALTASGGYLQSTGAAGDSACVLGVDSTHWQFHSLAGTWDNPGLLAHGASACTGSPCTTGTVTLNTTGATLLTIVDVSGGSNDPNSDSVTDGNGNTWNHLTSQINGGTGVATTIWYAYSKSSAGLSLSSTETFSLTGHYAAIEVAAWSGTQTYPTSAYAGQQGGITANSATSLQYASIACGGLLVAAAALHISGTYSVDTGLTILDQSNFASGQTIGMGAAYLFSTSAGVTPTWSATGSAGGIAIAMGCFQ
jgi:hypothetical protein